MYAAAFGLHHAPFSIAPDPRTLFMSERHREALAHLLYGVGGGGGFVLLTGEIGAGKTTVCRAFLEQVPPRCNVAVIFNPRLSVTELLATVCEEFHVPVRPRAGGAPTVKDHVDALNRFLLDSHAVGHHSVLIIDEAQSLSAEVLEQLRLLTNLETNEHKLLQIVLIGQPELRDMLARPDLEQLAQRVTARYHLQSLGEAETRQYVLHRLAVAGGKSTLFDAAALKRLHQLARGVPRRINLLADRALLGAWSGGRSRVDRAIVERAASEVFGDDAQARRGGRRQLVMVAVAGALVGAALLAAGGWLVDARTPPARLVPAAPAASVPAAATLPASAASAPMAPPGGGDEAAAWADLAGWWKLPAGAGEVCERAAGAGLLCFRGSAGLPLLRSLARPVLLALHESVGDAAPRHVLLLGLDDSHATLRIDGREQRWPLATLAAQWRGEFATLWRPPPGFVPPLVRDGEALAWLRRQLDALPGAAAADPALSPAEALRARVLAFQTAQGLPADGRAGPLTLMQLNRAAGIDEPRWPAAR